MSDNPYRIRKSGDRVVVVYQHREVWATVDVAGSIGYFVVTDDGERTWRHAHEVYDGPSEP